MFWKTKGSFFRTLTFRITLWYAALFGALSLVVFVIVYVALTSSLTQRTDEELLSTAKEFEALYISSGIEALRAEFRREAKSQGIRRVFYRFLSEGGRELASSDKGAWQGISTIPVSAMTREGAPSLIKTIRVPGHQDNVRLLSKHTADRNIIQIGATLHDNEILMRKYRETFAIALAMMLVFGGVVGWLVSRRAMSGVERVTQAALSIGKGDLDRRVPLGNEGQEINDLALAFNAMLDRIQALVKEMEEVTSNIAHDLRSPLTRIRGISETTLRSEQGIEDYREMAGAIIEEIDRLVGMITTMLEIAQTDSGVAQLSKSPVDICVIMQEAVDLFLPMAEDKNLALNMDTPKEPIIINADIARLQRALANILDNAIKYTEPGGRISVTARTSDSRAVIEIRDSGVGINESDLAHVFDRFYRGDRSRSTPGSGLGLSLARSVIQAHGGKIKATSSPGKGSTFTVFLPLLSSPA